MVIQASPSDPSSFPFVILGNKVDVDGGNSRVVRIYNQKKNKVLFILVGILFLRILIV